jgi:hypothetical protein
MATTLVLNKTETQAVTEVQSLSLIKNLMRVGVSTICYLRYSPTGLMGFVFDFSPHPVRHPVAPFYPEPSFQRTVSRAATTST